MAHKKTNLKKKLLLGAGIIAILAVVIFAITSLTGSKNDLGDVSKTSITEQGQVYFAIIDMYKITAESDALKGLNAKRQKFTEALKKEAKRREEALMKAKKEIESKQSVLSKEALQQKAGEYQRSLMAYQKEMQEKSASIEKLYRETLQKVQANTLDEVINDVAKKKNVSIVLNQAQTILLNKSLDITDDVIKVMNRRLPTVHMGTPKGF